MMKLEELALNYTFCTMWVRILIFLLVWRLMDNHTSQVNQFESKIINLQENLAICRNSTFTESKRVSVLVESQKTCRKTLEKVSKTLKSFSEAFKIQWERTNKAEGKLQKTLGHFSVLQKDLVYKDNITLKLQDSNDQLRQKVNIQR